MVWLECRTHTFQLMCHPWELTGKHLKWHEFIDVFNGKDEKINQRDVTALLKYRYPNNAIGEI
jgi:hypothetical protein